MRKKNQFIPVAGKLQKPRSNDMDQILSDHLYQVINLSDELQILSWNILTRGRKTNNAFGILEEEGYEDPYHKRLGRIVNELKAAVSQYENLGIIALQEAPAILKDQEYFFKQLKQALPEWVITKKFFNKSEGNPKFGVLTIYNPELVLTCQRVSIPGLTTQLGRVLATDITFHASTSEIKHIRVINGHFKFSEARGAPPFSTAQVQEEIEVMLQSIDEGQVVIAADFNHDLATLALERPFTRFIDNQPTSFSKTANESICELEAKCIDGFIFKYDP